MPLKNFHPKTGQILICDFDRGFIPPEMVKRRPIVVISRTETHSRRLCTVVPLSTTAPKVLAPWHIALERDPLHRTKTANAVWAKCDMIYTVSFDRLELPRSNIQNHQAILTTRISRNDLHAIFNGVRRYLPTQQIHHLAE